MTRKGNAPAGDGSTADRGTAPVTFSIKLPRQYCSAPHHHPHPHLFQRRQIQIRLYRILIILIIMIAPKARKDKDHSELDQRTELIIIVIMILTIMTNIIMVIKGSITKSRSDDSLKLLPKTELLDALSDRGSLASIAHEAAFAFHF